MYHEAFWWLGIVPSTRDNQVPVIPYRKYLLLYCTRLDVYFLPRRCKPISTLFLLYFHGENHRGKGGALSPETLCCPLRVEQTCSFWFFPLSGNFQPGTLYVWSSENLHSCHRCNLTESDRGVRGGTIEWQTLWMPNRWIYHPARTSTRNPQ